MNYRFFRKHIVYTIFNRLQLHNNQLYKREKINLILKTAIYKNQTSFLQHYKSRLSTNHYIEKNTYTQHQISTHSKLYNHCIKKPHITRSSACANSIHFQRRTFTGLKHFQKPNRTKKRSENKTKHTKKKTIIEYEFDRSKCARFVAHDRSKFERASDARQLAQMHRRFHEMDAGTCCFFGFWMVGVGWVVSGFSAVAGAVERRARRSGCGCGLSFGGC